MRRALVLTIGCLALLAPAAAEADVIRFEGDARITLYERLDHEDYQDVEATTVDLSIELHGARVPGFQTAEHSIGSATIGRDDGSMTTVILEGAMYPPEGSGGFVHAVGLGDDDSLYCFRIWDLVDAPTARPDRIIAAFEPRDRFTEGFLAYYSSAALTDICYALEYRMEWVESGDFEFSTIV